MNTPLTAPLQEDTDTREDTGTRENPGTPEDGMPGGGPPREDRREETSSTGDAPRLTLADLYLEAAAREGGEERRQLRIAVLIAVLFHLLLLTLTLPDLLGPPKQSGKVLFITHQRFQMSKPPPPPARGAPKKKQAKKIPIPDPTPDLPEPIEREFEVELAEEDFPEVGELALGIPDAPPGAGPGVPGGTGNAREIGEGVTPPVKIFAPQPQYTEKARQARIQGMVLLKGVVDEEGNVTRLEVLRGLPHGLTDSALETVGQWRYKPAMHEGEPVAVYFHFAVRFSLQ